MEEAGDGEVDDYTGRAGGAWDLVIAVQVRYTARCEEWREGQNGGLGEPDEIPFPGGVPGEGSLDEQQPETARKG